MKNRTNLVVFLCFIFIHFQNCSNKIQSDLSSDPALINSTSNQPVPRLLDQETEEVQPVSIPTTASTSTPQNRLPSQNFGQTQTNLPSTTPASSETTTSGGLSAAHVPEVSYDLAALFGTKLDSLVGRAQIVVATADVNKVGFFLFTMNFKNSVYVLDPDANKWLIWDQKLAGYMTSGISLKSTEGFGETLIHSLDMTAYGGATLSVGYGVGQDIVAAVKECLQTGRHKEVKTLEVQKFLGSVSIPPFKVDSGKTHTVQYFIRPSQQDYWTPGQYYIFAVSPEGIKMFFNGTIWINSEGLDLNTLYIARTESLENYKTHQLVPASGLGNYIGWKIYVGYGKSYQDMIDRKLVSSGYLIRPY